MTDFTAGTLYRQYLARLNDNLIQFQREYATWQRERRAWEWDVLQQNLQRPQTAWPDQTPEAERKSCMGDVVISGIHSTSQSIYVQAGLATSMSDGIQSVQYRTTPRDVNGDNLPREQDAASSSHRILATLTQSRGDVQLPQCTHCRRGLGPFDECVALGDVADHTCANCAWTGDR
ncbi:hypothetical protein C8Q69DRAFT_506341 [Paecilomyces variotii]|uniref:Uncharacterized protein n=1 Tax=Byssochlamys spectabilis TaxID=264951 RepID=A0A443HWK4_BYSSP|nr:hypothetical protein C8Q69DRAFT_506341 [Paecilomyces variotii]RWQ96140.1 hypothetical protein C8Q69DRAFT_506341 [Paecilomyces variotii]